MAVSIYENVKRALQDIVAPELRALQVEIKRLDEKIDNVKEEVRNLRGEFKLAIDIHERLAAVEAKLSR